MEKSIIDRFFSRTANRKEGQAKSSTVAKHLCNVCGEETYRNGAGENVCLCCDALEAECTCKEKMAAKNEKQAVLIPGKYIVTGQAYNRKSGRVVGPMRDEVIDTRTNELFKDVKSLGDIEAVYESFWNDLNPDSEEVVKVFSIKASADQGTEDKQAVDKQTTYAANLRSKIDADATTFDKENWSTPGTRPGKVYRSAKKRVGRLNREQWQLVNDAAENVAIDFKEITGVDPVDTIDVRGQFYQDVVDKTIPTVKDYLGKKHPEIIGELYDEFLYKLDEELMSRYADEAVERAGGYDKVYRENKEAKMNTIGIATDLWDRGIIGDNKLQALKDCKNEKIRHAEVLRIARANKLTDVIERIGSNLDGQVETKDDKGYPRATGPSKTPADVGGTSQRLPGNAEPSKNPASHGGTENRAPGVKEPKKVPWEGWKQKYDLKEEGLADSPTPASSGGTDKRLPGVSEPESHPKGGYPGTHAKKRLGQKEDITFLASAIDEAMSFIQSPNSALGLITELVEAYNSGNSGEIRRLLKQIEKARYRVFDEGLYHLPSEPLQQMVERFISIVSGELGGEERDNEPGVTAGRENAEDRAHRSVKAQHRTPFELMKEKRIKESQIEGMPHKVEIKPTKQENLGDPESKIKEQAHGKTTDSLNTKGEENPETEIAGVKNDYAPLGHPEGSELQKSIEGMFTYPPGTEPKERRGQVGAGETSLVVEDFSLPGDSETKIDWDLPKGERNEAPKTISADPTMTEQKSTEIPKENTFKGETNEKPGSSQLKEQIASKDSIEVTCEQCHTAMVLTGDEFKEWADMGKTMCKCGNLVSVDLSNTSLSEDLFTSPAVSEDKARDLTGKKKKAKKGQVDWSKTASKTKEESIMDLFVGDMSREAQIVTEDESGYGAKPEKKDETLEHDYDKDYREKMLDENKEDKTQDEREKELKKAAHNIQVGNRVWMKEHEGTVLFRVDEIEPGETPEESTAFISELETGRYGQWIDLEDLVLAFPETGIKGKKADCGHCGNPGVDEPCDGEQCPYCAEYMGEDASEELHDMGEVECPHCRKVVEATKKEAQATDSNAVCGNIWYNGTDEQRSSFKGGTQGRGKDEKPPKEWFDDCLSKVSRTAQKAPKLYDSQGKQLVAFRGEEGWTLKAVQESIYKRGTYQEIENFVDKKIEQGEFSTKRKAQLSVPRRGQLSETDPMQMETGKPTSEIEKIQMSREKVDKPIDVIMTPSIERSERAGSPIDPTFMAERIETSLRKGYYHTAQEGFNNIIRTTKDITSAQIAELKGLMTELGYDVTEQKGVVGKRVSVVQDDEDEDGEPLNKYAENPTEWSKQVSKIVGKKVRFDDYDANGRPIYLTGRETDEDEFTIDEKGNVWLHTGWSDKMVGRIK